MARASVCLMPYAQIDFNRTLFPVKLIHYLAAGRPIATVPLEAIGAFADVVEVGEGPAGFANAIARAANADTAEDGRRRRERVGTFSWDARIDLLEGYVENALERSAGATADGSPGASSACM
jgi:glycosyltransferase involved in cell wall biosynthesis